MGDAWSIDLAPAEGGDPLSFQLGLWAKAPLKAPVLWVEELTEVNGELSWGVPTRPELLDPIDGLVHQELDGLHLYARTWSCPGAEYGATYRLKYNDEADVVHSHEYFTVVAPEAAKGVKSPLTGQDGGEAGKGPTSLGTLHLSMDLAIRLVAAEASPRRSKSGGELLEPFLPKDPSVYAPIKDRHVALFFVTKRPGTSAKGLTVLKLRSDGEGWLYDPDPEKSDGAARAFLRFNSPYVRVEGDLVQLHVQHFFAIVDKDLAGLDRRVKLLRAAADRREATKDDPAATRIFRETSRLLVDSFLDERGGLPANALFFLFGKDGRPTLRTLDDGVSARVVYLPVRRLSTARWLELFDFEREGAALVETAWKISEDGVEELISHDGVKRATTEGKKAATDLAEKARAYFKTHPEALLCDDPDSGWLGRSKMRRVADQLLTSLLLTMRKEYLQQVGEGVTEVDPDSLPDVIKNAREQLGRASRGLTLGLLMGAYHYLRVDVAYVAGERLLRNLLAVYGKVFATVGFDPDKHVLAPTAKEELGRFAVNLVVQYYIESSRIKSAGPKAKKGFQRSFRATLLTLGVYDTGDGKDTDDPRNAAARMMQTLGVYAGRLRLEPSLLKKIAEGTEVEHLKPLRDELLMPLAHAAAAAWNQLDKLNTHTLMDIYQQWSLFRDYPSLTELVHEAYGIKRLDADDHPNGPKLGTSGGWDKVKDLTFNECAMHLGGLAMEARGKTMEFAAKLFEIAIVVLTPEVLLVKGAKVLYDGLTLAGATVFEVLKAKAEVKDAYERAIVGLGSLDDAKKTSTRVKLDIVLGLALEGVNLGRTLKEKDGLSWPDLGQVYDAELVKEGRRKVETALMHRVIQPLVKKTTKSKAARAELNKAMEEIIRFTFEHAGKYAYSGLLRTLKEDGFLKETGVKELFDAFALELAMREEFGVPMASQTIDFVPLEKALDRLAKAMK